MARQTRGSNLPVWWHERGQLLLGSAGFGALSWERSAASCAAAGRFMELGQHSSLGLYCTFLIDLAEYVKADLGFLTCEV